MAGPGSDSGRLVSVRRACPPHPSSATLLPNILSGCNPRSRNLSLPAYSPPPFLPSTLPSSPLLNTRFLSHSVRCTPSLFNHSLYSHLFTPQSAHSHSWKLLPIRYSSTPHVLCIGFTSLTVKVSNTRCGGVASTPPHHLSAFISSHPFIIPCSTQPPSTLSSSALTLPSSSCSHLFG